MVLNINYPLNTDINECNTNNGGCGQLCTNTQGSRQCTCMTGFTLATDGRNCNGQSTCILVTVLHNDNCRITIALLQSIIMTSDSIAIFP